MKNAIETVLVISTVILVADVTFYMLWVISGQTPVDGYYLGAITSYFVELFK